MKNILAIMSKEFARFFYDKRMIIGTLAPAILIYVIYSFMGTMMDGIFGPDDDYQIGVNIVNLPASIEEMVHATDFAIIEVAEGDIDIAKESVSERETHLLVIFPADFDAQVAVFDAQTATQPAPNVIIHFNTTEPNSQVAYMTITSILDTYESMLVNKFDINRGVYDADLATAEEVAATIIASIMPMLLMIFLFSSCMGLALESITGEKERGTMATLLVSPLKRRELAIGKILSLAVLSFISGAVMAIATIMALPNLVVGGAEGGLDVNIYSFTDYALLALVIMTTLLLMVVLISIISANAKSVKEGGTAVTPLMFVFMLVGIGGMFGGGASENPLIYLIPAFGSAQSMTGIFAQNYSITNILIASASTLAYAIIGGFALTKMFNSEKVMFSK